MIQLRNPYIAPIHRLNSLAPRVGLIEETVDSMTATSHVGQDAVDNADEEFVANSPDAPELDTFSVTSDPDSDSTVTDEAAIIENDTRPTPKTKKVSAPTATGVALTKSIQTMLQSLGYNLGPKAVDGIIGPYTRGAIVKFKQDHSITPANATITADFRKALADASAKKKGVTSPAPGAASASGAGNIWIAVVAAVVAVGAYFLLRKP